MGNPNVRRLANARVTRDAGTRQKIPDGRDVRQHGRLPKTGGGGERSPARASTRPVVRAWSPEGSRTPGHPRMLLAAGERTLSVVAVVV